MNANQAPTRPPGSELFFAPLLVVFDPNTCERIEFAYITSKFGHYKQVRDDGTRYFDHPKAAAWIYIQELLGRDPEIIIDLLLHDLQEDSYLLSPYRIALNFGAERAFDIRALTKLPKGKETTEEYLARVIARGPRVVLSKLCDRLHNNRCMVSYSAEKRTKQIKETREYHLKLLVPALRGCGTQWADYADEMENMIIDALAQYEK